MTIIVDTRENTPWVFPPGIKTMPGSLTTGDYSLKGLEDYITIERKEFSDFISCCASSRERFERELHRMRSYWVKAVIIEGTYESCRTGNYRSKILPQCVTGSIASWTGRYSVPFLFVGSFDAGSELALKMFKAFDRRLINMLPDDYK